MASSSATQYDPSYQKFLDEFFPLKNACDNVHDLIKLIEKFGYTFMIQNADWRIFCRSEIVANCDSRRTLWISQFHKETNELVLLLHQCYYQFNFTRESLAALSRNGCEIEYTLFFNDRNAYQRDITLPHDDLGHSYAQCIKAAYSPISNDIKEQFSKSQALFKKIKRARKDEEKWIETLKEAGDDLFVQQNVEFRLGQNMLNKKLWKLYISYLKDVNPTIMLHTYSKYCRFWTEDMEMKKEYENQVEIYGPISVPWRNPFDFEIYDPEAALKLHKQFWHSEFVETTRTKIRSKEIKMAPIGIYFSKENMICQNFSLPKTMINYIFKNAISISIKLSLCCKGFHSKRENILYCYKLALIEKEPYWFVNPHKHIDFIENSVRICHVETPDVFPGKKLVLSKRLFVHAPNTNPKLLSKFIPKIVSCEARYLEIQFQHLTFKEYQFLTDKDMVLELILIEVKIVDDDEMDVPLEDLLKMVLNVRLLEIGRPRITPQTSLRMSELPFKSAFERFYLWRVLNVPEPHALCRFMKKNFCSNCKVRIDIPFNDHANEQRKDFINIVHQTLRKLHVFDIDWHSFSRTEKYAFCNEDPMWNNRHIRCRISN